MLTNFAPQARPLSPLTPSLLYEGHALGTTLQYKVQYTFYYMSVNVMSLKDDTDASKKLCVVSESDALLWSCYCELQHLAGTVGCTYYDFLRLSTQGTSMSTDPCQQTMWT